ncbi:MAG: hypothetical protein M3O30_01975 [Planctomycetota bacterium]|nr:hypothetical protein [Planctomycetota bacterium]
MSRIKGPCAALVLITLLGCGCTTHKPMPYGEERQLFLPGPRPLVWAVAPTLNLSGQSHVDPLLQSDLVFQQLQEVHGLTILPVNRVAEIYASLKIDKVQSEGQAYAVCQLLGCDGLVVPTVTVFDPYDPPKLGASLQLFLMPGSFDRGQLRVDPHALERAATPGAPPSLAPRGLVQAVGMYDAADGTVVDRANAYAAGRTNPNGLLGPREIFVSMDRYCEFVYHELIVQLLDDLRPAPNAMPAKS